MAPMGPFCKPRVFTRGYDFYCEDAAGIPPQSLLRKASSPKGTPLGNAGNFAATPEAVPLGKVAANVVSRRKGSAPERAKAHTLGDCPFRTDRRALCSTDALLLCKIG